MLCGAFVVFLQLQGVFFGMLLGLGWFVSSCTRALELDRVLRTSSPIRKRALKNGDRAKNNHSHPAERQSDHQSNHNNEPSSREDLLPLPGVSVVLPVKGCKLHSVNNWRTQLALEYGGLLEFIFVVDCVGDEAYGPLNKLLREKRVKGRPARLVVAGRSKHCSQKIHNIVCGISATSASSEYLLLLDDDVALHPGALEQTVVALRSRSECWMATGYPFDIPQPGATVFTYCVLVYHFVLIIGVSISDIVHFIWGGYMLMPLKDLRDDKYGFMEAWVNGGYSDDLIAASRCGEKKLQILCPLFAAFPQRLDGGTSFSAYLNYLRRQLYPMDTYSNTFNKWVNHGMALGHSYMSWSVVLPIFSVICQLLYLSWALAGAAVVREMTGHTTPGLLDYLAMHTDTCYWTHVSTAIFIATLCFMQYGMYQMTYYLLELFAALNPTSKKMDIASFSWPKLWLGLVINNALLPFVMLYTFLSPSVVWSGIRYTKQGGKVVHLEVLNTQYNT